MFHFGQFDFCTRLAMVITALFLAGLFYHNPLAAIPVTAVVGLLYWLVKYNYRFWEIDGVPHPKPSLFTGNLGSTLMLKKHISQLASDWYNAFPNAAFVGYFKLLTPAIMVKDPELIKNILTRDFDCFSTNDFMVDPKQDPLLAHDPFLVSGERWKRARAALTPSFTGAKMKQLFPVMESVADAFVAFIGRHVGEELEAKQIATRFTTQNVVACTFGVDGDCFAETESEFRRMGRRVFETSLPATFRMMLAMFLPTLAQLLPIPFLSKDVDQWIRSLVRRQVLQRKDSDGSVHNGFLQSILKNDSYSPNDITGQALSIFLEGFESSGGTLGAAIHKLAKNPNVQEKLFEEISKQVAASGGSLDYEALLKIEYLDWVVLETLRLNPPAATMHKLSTKKYILRRGERDDKGHDMGIYVREGTPILIPMLALHMDPKYFPEPQTFDPERFSPARKVTHPGTVFFPFGEGPRMCLGMRFGQAQVKLALVKLLLSYRVKVGPNDKPFSVDIGSILYQSKHGLQVVFEKRS